MHYLPTNRTLQTCTKMYMWGPERDLEGLSNSQKGLLGFHQERKVWEPRPPASWGQHLLPRTPGHPALAKGLSHLCDQRTGQSIPTTRGSHPCRQDSSTSSPPNSPRSPVKYRLKMSLFTSEKLSSNSECQYVVLLLEPHACSEILPTAWLPQLHGNPTRWAQGSSPWAVFVFSSILFLHQQVKNSPLCSTPLGQNTLWHDLIITPQDTRFFALNFKSSCPSCLQVPWNRRSLWT